MRNQGNAPRLPDFFIVGAPKSGTTALYSYLKQHPDLFLPETKDVSFFGRDLAFRTRRITADEYRAAFTRAREQRRVGDASVWYLYSKVAAAELRRFEPQASIIAMVRNPIDMLHAQHSEFLYNCNEDIDDFAEALQAEPDRKRGARVPRAAHFVAGLFYRETVRYAEQLARYFNAFGRENVHVIVFDDFCRETGAEVAATLAFLGVDPSFRPELGIVNSNKVVRNRRLHSLLMWPPARLTAACTSVLPPRARGRILPALRRLNVREEPRQPLTSSLRRELQRELLPEVERLSEMLQRDLTYWCRG